MPDAPQHAAVEDRRLVRAAAAAEVAAQRLGAMPGLAYLHELDLAVIELARLRDEAIGAWVNENPDWSYRRIAGVLGRSKSDVHRLATAYENQRKLGPIDR